MFFIYEETHIHPTRSGVGMDFSKEDPHIYIERHLKNQFYLQFILHKSDRVNEKMQATKELEICERKLKFWRQQRSYDSAIEARLVAQLRKTWNT